MICQEKHSVKNGINERSKAELKSWKFLSRQLLRILQNRNKVQSCLALVNEESVNENLRPIFNPKNVYLNPKNILTAKM